MTASRKPAATGKPRAAKSPPTKIPPAATACRRCGAPGAVGEDGFCAKCEKALEQACL